jgi:hypothetical protein
MPGFTVVSSGGPWVEQYLTLAIAVGGIATGIGAIWTAIVGRRQLTESRVFLREQAAIARREAQLSEQNLAEQRQIFQEQNERARINLEVDLMYKLWEQWESRTYQEHRRKSIKYVKQHFIVNKELQEVRYLDGDTRVLFAYYDEVGYLTRAGVLRLERVMISHAASVRLGWALFEPAVKLVREEEGDPNRFANFEYLYRQGLDFARRRGGTGAPPTKEELLHFIEREGQTEAELHSAVSATQRTGVHGEEENAVARPAGTNH